MPYDSDRPSSSSGGGMAVVLALLVLGLVVFGGGAFVWLTRMRVAEQAALAERAAAVSAQMAAQAAVESEALLRETLERGQRDATQQDPLGATRQVEADLPAANMIDIVTTDGARRDASITIDAEGQVAIHGVAIPLEQIGDKLKELVAIDASELSELTVSIWADDACDFRHVAEVVRQCEAVGLGTVRIAVPLAGEGIVQPD